MPLGRLGWGGEDPVKAPGINARCIFREATADTLQESEMEREMSQGITEEESGLEP